MSLPPWGFRRRSCAGRVRVSLGWTTTKADIERFLSAWRKLASALSKGSKEQPRHRCLNRLTLRPFEWFKRLKAMTRTQTDPGRTPTITD